MLSNKKINFQDSSPKDSPKIKKDTSRSETSTLSVIIEVILIICCLIVIGWAVFLARDAQRAKYRDNQRIVMIKEIQNALGEFYKVHGSYPKITGVFLTALINQPEMKPFYNPDKFRDPCFSDEKVSNLSTVKCKDAIVTYYYINLYDNKTEGYKIIVTLESSGKKEFISKQISNNTP